MDLFFVYKNDVTIPLELDLYIPYLFVIYFIF
jgi:hypothetical protein